MDKTANSGASQAARVRRGARLLRHVIYASVVALLLTILASWLLPGGGAGGFTALVEIREDGLPRGAAIGIGLLLGALMLAGLARLVRMLRLIEAGELFSPPVTRELRAFTRFALWSALVSTLGTPVVRLTAMLSGNGTRELKLSADSTEIWLLLFTGLSFLIARLLDEATRIADDNRQIV